MWLSWVLANPKQLPLEMGDGSLLLREADELTFCLSVSELILHRLLSQPMQVFCSWPRTAPFRGRRDHLPSED